MRYLSAPVEVSIELTNLCNLYCDHCYSFSGPFEFSDELTYQEITKLIDDIIEMKVFRLSLVGGEPFLRTDAVNIVGYAKGKELATVASTNGYYLDNDKLRRLHEYGIDNIQFSIDGAKAETHDKIRGTEGSFDRAVDAARRAKGFGIPITMGTTIMSSNYREMPDMLALAKDIDVDCFHVMGLQPGGRGQKDFCHKAASDDAWLEITQYTQHAIEEGKYKFPIKLQGC